MIAPPPSHITTLSLHDALPISLNSPGLAQMPASGSAVVPARIASSRRKWVNPCSTIPGSAVQSVAIGAAPIASASLHRSEEHTSELQSLRHLVCRLLLEKKNQK